MAMPVGSMIAKFRPEFEAHIEAAARQRARSLDQGGTGFPVSVSEEAGLSVPATGDAA
jgi:hypothetical protein